MGSGRSGRFVSEHLAADARTRAWISAYSPSAASATAPEIPGGPDTTNILHAADIWYSIKEHWCVAAQRLIRAQRAEARD